MRGGPVIGHSCSFDGIVRHGRGVDHSGRGAPEGREDLRGNGYLRQPARFARACFVGRLVPHSASSQALSHGVRFYPNDLRVGRWERMPWGVIETDRLVGVMFRRVVYI